MRVPVFYSAQNIPIRSPPSPLSRYNNPMKLSDLLDTRVITVNLRARDRNGAFAEMAGMLRKAGRIGDSAPVLRALQDREALGSTGLGRGIAFPHARVDGLSQPVALLALSPGRRGVLLR